MDENSLLPYIQSKLYYVDVGTLHNKVWDFFSQFVMFRDTNNEGHARM